jgi:hypothetical protein
MSTVTINEPDTDKVSAPLAQPQAEAWTLIMDLWRTAGLPTPLTVSVDYQFPALPRIRIELPDDERGQVEAWAAALGTAPGRLVLENSMEKLTRYVAGESLGYVPGGSHLLPDWHVEIICWFRTRRDAVAKHWSGSLWVPTHGDAGVERIGGRVRQLCICGIPSGWHETDEAAAAQLAGHIAQSSAQAVAA